jgi:hypothetical protein
VTIDALGCREANAHSRVGLEAFVTRTSIIEHPEWRTLEDLREHANVACIVKSLQEFPASCSIDNYKDVFDALEVLSPQA